jgi:acyl carrier protein
MKPRNMMIEVKRVISELLDVDVKDIQPESRLVDDLGADSLALVELLLTLEEEFELDAPDEDVNRIVIVQDIVDYLDKCPQFRETC